MFSKCSRLSIRLWRSLMKSSASDCSGLLVNLGCLLVCILDEYGCRTSLLVLPNFEKKNISCFCCQRLMGCELICFSSSLPRLVIHWACNFWDWWMWSCCSETDKKPWRTAQIFFETFFASIELQVHLKEKKIYSVSTVRTNRIYSCPFSRYAMEEITGIDKGIIVCA